MTWFKRKKMSEDEISKEDIEGLLEEDGEEIPVIDKRKFKADGERVAKAEEKQEHVPPIVAKLEEEVAVERQRREAAEHKLVGVQSKFDELRAQMERDTAEMRQRLQRHNEQRMQIEKSEFLTTLLPILDNLGLAVKAGETDASFENLYAGVKGTARMFEQTLLGLGVEPIAAIGADFDPELHEAVEMVEAAADQDGKITAEFSRGYRFGDRLLRPSRVQVGKAA
jgi:molecular chaperone GrpE